MALLPKNRLRLSDSPMRLLRELAFGVCFVNFFRFTRHLPGKWPPKTMSDKRALVHLDLQKFKRLFDFSGIELQRRRGPVRQ
jgi:hypothetical protein